MPYSKLRSAERISLRVPLRFRPVAEAPRDLFEGETVNVSENGLFFTTNHPPQFGVPLDLIVMMPGDTSGENKTPVRCRARVVRVQDIPAAQQAGVAVKIEYFVRSTAAAAQISLAQLNAEHHSANACAAG
ncbi:MAG: PilZ domain-containing protein [Candidatus Acidiferrales bacterium]